MASVVVSGRVDEEVKRRADAYIRAAGSNPAKVINDVWVRIAYTGEVPQEDSRLGSVEERMKRFEEFMEFCDSLPPVDERYLHMTDDEILAEAMEEKYGPFAV